MKIKLIASTFVAVAFASGVTVSAQLSDDADVCVPQNVVANLQRQFDQTPLPQGPATPGEDEVPAADLLPTRSAQDTTYLPCTD